MLLFNAICINIIGIFLGTPVLSSALIFSTLYIWCQINKESIVQFWFGIQIKVTLCVRACVRVRMPVLTVVAS